MYSLKRMCERLTQKISKRALIILLAASMMLAGAAGGTIAYLHSGAQEVRNTFTFGDISITLQETDTGLDGDDNVNTNRYQMNIGQAIAKDPTVTVLSGSVDCWLFVKLEQSENLADFMEYTIADGWTPVGEDGNLIVREVCRSAADQSYPVLRDNLVTVKDTVTLSDFAALSQADYPTLSFTAYAVQRENAETAEAAWLLIAGEE